MARMSERELLAAIEQREQRSYGFASGELAEQRTAAIERFLSKPYGDELEGRSAAVSSDTRDTVLWIMPQLMRVFLGGDEITRFEPIGPEDEQGAKLETDYMNHIMLERNNSFQQFGAFLQDAALHGNGYAKVWWHTDSAVLVERYSGKTDDELAALMQDSDVEVTEHTQYPDPDYVPMPDQAGMVAPPTNLHDVVVRRTKATEYARYEAVPPEEIYVDRAARSSCMQELAFVQHRRQLTVSELREMGYKIPDDIASWRGDNVERDDERDARDRFDEDYVEDDDGENDPASRRITYKETYLRIDADRDGKAELRKVCSVAKKILHDEETDCIPFVSFAAIPFAHRHHALGIYDLVKDIEKIRTNIIRQYLDGLRVQNNPRTAVNASRVNVDDLLTARPNGLVRVDGLPMENIMAMPVAPTGPQAMEGLQWLDQWKMDASGVSPYFQGGQSLDATSLNKTATGVSQLISQAQMRVEAIARSLADGVRELVQLLHGLTLKHATRADKARLKNQWVLIDPREWVKRDNVTVQVALGSGTKEMRAAQLQQMIALQMQLLPIGVVTPDRIYNSVARLANELGYRNADEFVSNPAEQPPQPPPPPDPIVQAQQIKTQGDLQKAQMEMQAQAGVDQRELGLKQAEMQQQAELERFKAQLQMEQARFEAELKAQTQIQIAQITEGIKAQGAAESRRMDMEAAHSERERQGSSEAQMGGMHETMMGMQSMVQALAAELTKLNQPRTIVRDQRGRVIGTATQGGEMVHSLDRDEMGRVAGVSPAKKLQ